MLSFTLRLPSDLRALTPTFASIQLVAQHRAGEAKTHASRVKLNELLRGNSY